MYCLINDDDGHWYVCPVDKEKEAHEYFELLCEYPFFYHNYDNPDIREPPDYLIEVNGDASLVQFDSFKLNGKEYK